MRPDGPSRITFPVIGGTGIYANAGGYMNSAAWERARGDSRFTSRRSNPSQPLTRRPEGETMPDVVLTHADGRIGMAGMFAPLADGKVDDWRGWVAELNGPRKAEFEDMNSRHELTEHRAYLQPMPDGSSAVLVIYEGSGADSFLPAVMASDHEFDRWFVSNVVELHGMDSTGPMPLMAQRMI